nr:Ig-like domain-containing protein [Cytobacillus citreus]
MPDFTAPGVPGINNVTDSATSISGKAEANSVVKLYINEKYSQQTKADKNGNYKFNISKLSAGTKIKVTATDEAGNESAASTTTVIDKTAPNAPKVDKVTAKSKSVTGTTEKDATVQVYNGKTLLGEAKANSKGKFTVKIKAQKAGTSLNVVAKDKAGNKSESTVTKVASK